MGIGILVFCSLKLNIPMKRIIALSVAALALVALIELQSRKALLQSPEPSPATNEVAEMDQTQPGASDASNGDRSVEVEVSFSPRITE